MFQREVAERIVAKARRRSLWPARRAVRLAHGGADRLQCRARSVHAAAQGHLQRGAPEAEGNVAMACRCAISKQVTRAAFGQRRKMVRQSLKSLGVPMRTAARRRRAQGDERAEVLAGRHLPQARRRHCALMAGARAHRRGAASAFSIPVAVPLFAQRWRHAGLSPRSGIAFCLGRTSTRLTGRRHPGAGARSLFGLDAIQLRPG